MYKYLLRQVKIVNINYTLTESICLSVLLIIALASYSCDKNTTNPVSKEQSFEISCPLNQKSVYASQLYHEDNDSLHLGNLLIYSVQFMEKRATGDTLFYKGEFNKYFKNYDDNTILTDSSEIILAFWGNWIFLQENRNRDWNERILTKQIHSVIDTTIFVIWDTKYFSMYPRYLKDNNQALLLIPGYSTLHTFTYTTDQFETWSDIYGEESGLRYTVYDTVIYHDRPLNNYSTSIIGLIDKHGVIMTQKSRLGFIARMNADTWHVEIDTVMFYDLTRRITDFTDPVNIVDLSVYADIVEENGFDFFIKTLKQ